MRNVEGSQRQKVFWAPYQQVLHYLQQGCGLDPTLPVDVVNCGAVVCSHSLPWTTIAGSICAGAPVERLDGPLPWAPMPAWQSKLSPPQSELPLQCRPSGFWQNSPQPGRIWHSSSSWWQSLTELGATLIWLCGKWPILWTWPWQWGYLNRRRRSHHSCRAVAALCPHTCWTCREMGSSRTAACCSRRLSPGRQNTGTSCVSVPPWHENKHLSGWWWWTSCLIESVPAISSWSACGTSLPMYWFRMRISKMGLKHPIFLGTKEICRVKPLLSVMSGNDRHLVLITGAGSHRRENLFPLERRNTATRENNPVSVFCPSTPITRSCDAISRHSGMGHHIVENVPTVSGIDLEEVLSRIRRAVAVSCHSLRSPTRGTQSGKWCPAEMRPRHDGRNEHVPATPSLEKRDKWTDSPLLKKRRASRRAVARHCLYRVQDIWIGRRVLIGWLRTCKFQWAIVCVWLGRSITYRVQ